MAQKPASLFELGDELSPNFDIFIEGKDTSSASSVFEAIRPLISSVSYEEDEEMAGLFELRVVNQPDIKLGSGSFADWKAVLDCKAFAEGNGVDLFMGYAGVKQYMGRVEIVKWMPRGGPQGVGEFVVKGFDGRHKMMQGNQYKAKTAKEDKTAKAGGGGGSKVSLAGKSPKGSKGSAQKQKHVYKAMTDDLIVKKVAAKYGYAADCDTPEKGLGAKAKKGGSRVDVHGGGKIDKTKRRTAGFPARIQPEDQTDWQFLQKLASINRFDLWVDYDLEKKQWVVHFKQRADAGNPILTFSYNGNDGSLLEWEGDFSVKEQSNTAEVVYFDRKKRSVVLTTIQDETKEENVSFGAASPGSFAAKKTVGAGARVRFTAFGQSLEAVADKPFRSQKDAEEFVKQWMKEREKDLVVLKGRVVGVETLRPRQVHEFLGMSVRLDGLYRLTQVKHVMQAGQPYTVEFVANKVLSEEITRRKATSKANVKAKTGKVTFKSGGQVVKS